MSANTFNIVRSIIVLFGKGLKTEICATKFAEKHKGYGLGNILLRSTFSLQYGQVCFLPTIHQPRIQNSWNLKELVRESSDKNQRK